MDGDSGADLLGGQTNLQEGLQDAAALLAGWYSEAHTGNVFVVSDGDVNTGDRGDDLADEVAALSMLASNIQAVGIGDEFDFESLSVVDPTVAFYSTMTDIIGGGSPYATTSDLLGDFNYPEMPMEGVVFNLIGVDGLGNHVDLVTTTNADGEIWFTGLYPGDYTLLEGVPHGWTNPDSSWSSYIYSGQEYAWAEGAAMLTPLDEILKDEIVDTDLIFKNYVLGSIHGFKFNDATANGVFDAGDTAFPGIQFRLDGPGGPYHTFSNLSGYFEFVGLKPGHYTLTEIDHVGDDVIPTTATSAEFWVLSGQEYVAHDGQAGPLPDLSGDDPYFPTKTEIQTDSLLFGNTVLGSIHGFKFEDYNGDGTYDYTAPVLNADEPILDDGIDNDGDGHIDNMYEDVLPFRPGVQTSEDTPWAGWTFELLDAGMNLIDSAVSNGDGEFGFDDLLPGTYYVREVEGSNDPLGNIRASTPPLVEVTVKSGQEHVWELGAAQLGHPQQFEYPNGDLLFGNYIEGSLHGCVYLDDNPTNGQYDSPGEHIIGGVEVALYEDGVLVAGSTRFVPGSGPNAGLFSYEDLAPGNYEVRVTAGSLGGGAVTDTFDVVTVSSGEEWVHTTGLGSVPLAANQYAVDAGEATLIGIVLPPPPPAGPAPETADAAFADAAFATDAAFAALESEGVEDADDDDGPATSLWV